MTIVKYTEYTIATIPSLQYFIPQLPWLYCEVNSSP